jgi:hypothetical protein
MKVIRIPVDDAEKMVLKHQFLLKEALAAASYHQEQIDSLTKAVKDVTFMLDESKQTLGGSDSGSTGEPASTAPRAQEVDGDAKPETVKKNDLIEILKAYENKHGKLDLDAEMIANFLLTK